MLKWRWIRQLRKLWRIRNQQLSDEVIAFAAVALFAALVLLAIDIRTGFFAREDSLPGVLVEAHGGWIEIVMIGCAIGYWLHRRQQREWAPIRDILYADLIRHCNEIIGEFTTPVSQWVYFVGRQFEYSNWNFSKDSPVETTRGIREDAALNLRFTETLEEDFAAETTKLEDKLENLRRLSPHLYGLSVVARDLVGRGCQVEVASAAAQLCSELARIQRLKVRNEAQSHEGFWAVVCVLVAVSFELGRAVTRDLEPPTKAEDFDPVARVQDAVIPSRTPSWSVPLGLLIVGGLVGATVYAFIDAHESDGARTTSQRGSEVVRAPSRTELGTGGNRPTGTLLTTEGDVGPTGDPDIASGSGAPSSGGEFRREDEAAPPKTTGLQSERSTLLGVPRPPISRPPTAPRGEDASGTRSDAIAGGDSTNSRRPGDVEDSRTSPGE